MIMFTFDPEKMDMTEIDKKERRKRLTEVLRKFQEADEQLDAICLELGIPKPELVCCGYNK